MTSLTFEELIEDLEECVNDGVYYEIAPEVSKILLDGIRDLQARLPGPIYENAVKALKEGDN